MALNVSPFSLFLGVGSAGAAVAALFDWRSSRIPYWLTLSTATLALCIHGVKYGLYSPGQGGLLWSLAGAVVTAFVPWLLWRSSANESGERILGGGDVHLFAAMGAVFGARGGVEIVLVSFVLAAVWTLAKLAWDGVLLRSVWNLLRSLAAPALRHKVNGGEFGLTRVRLAPAVFVAVLLVSPGGLRVLFE